MAIIRRTNQRISPANNRAVDVAKQALEGVIDIQQRRYYNAFQIQGYRSVLYHRLKSGLRCSCQSQSNRINTLLNEDGTASPGLVNDLLTGNQFGVEPYGSNPGGYDTFQISTSKSTFDVKSKGGMYDNEHIVESGVGDNGNVAELDLEDLVADFDSTSFGFSDVSCNVCFGTGFIGGYQPLNANRQVITCDRVELINGNIEFDRRPFHATCDRFNVQIIIPRGILDIDQFVLWDGNVRVPFQAQVEGLPFRPEIVYHMADGKPHQWTFIPSGPFTHLELQFNMSSDQALFEFPRLTKSSDISLLQQTEPFQIIVSPNVPHLNPEDILVESTFGTPLIVQGTPMWNTRNRHVLGWECQVRPVQPQELYSLLPKRHRVYQKPRTTNMVHDNKRGQRS